MQDYLRGTVEEYLKGLSERSIVPGGGSASALAAALGAGLNLMVMNYSIKPGDFGEAAQELLSVRERQRKSMDRLSLLVDEDCKAFRELMEALQAGHGTEKEYIIAAAVPMETCRECGVSMDITAYLAEKANKKLMTDVGCAAHILKAAFHSARLNAEINLKYVKDRSFIEKAEEELKAIRKEIDIADDKIDMVLKNISNPED